METRAFRAARTEYRALAGEFGGLERDQARVRVGAAEYQDSGTAAAYPYLRQLDLPESEADAERLDYLVECTRHLTDDDEMKSTLDRLARHYPHSPWRLKALLSAANRFLLVNRPDEFVPLDKAVYQDFPNAPEAALAHWKVTFQAYLHDDPQAQPLLMEHVRNYPAHATAARPSTPGPLVRTLRRPWRSPRLLPAAHRRLGKPLLRRAGAPAETGGCRAQGPNWRVPCWPVDTRGASGAARSLALHHAAHRTLPPAAIRRPLRYRRFRTSLRRAHRWPTGAAGMEMAGAAEVPHQAMRIMKGMASEYLSLPFSAAPRKFWELLFPLPYRADLERTARDAGLDPFCWPDSSARNRSSTRRPSRQPMPTA